MKKTTFNTVAVSGLVLSISLSLPPQVASAVANCGSFGADLNVGGFCEITYSGDVNSNTVRTFTVPTGATNLQAIIVGGGSGSYFIYQDVARFTTLAGNAGKVRYVDLSSVEAGTVITHTSGKSGVSGPWGTDGGTSSISYGSNSFEAAGGVFPTITDPLCTFNFTHSSTVFTDPAKTRQGASSTGESLVNGDGSCGTLAQGVDASTDVDSFGNPALSMYAASNGAFFSGNRLGNGGGIDPTTDTMAFDNRVRTPGIGDGGSIAVELRTHVTDLAGADGLGRVKETSPGGVGAVFFRWTPGEANSGNTGSGSTGGGISGGNASDRAGSTGNALASTGSDYSQLATWATGFLALGVVIVNLMPRGRRKKTTPNH